MLPVIALIGRQNVGKSTLFNRLTKSREALVADYPGLTRDRQYGFGKVGSVAYIVIDTGGISGEEEGINEFMAEQTLHAIEEADAVLFMVDGREGLNATDEYVAAIIRKKSKKIFLVSNKSEGLNPETASLDFHSLGLGKPNIISALHGDYVLALMDEVLNTFEGTPLKEFDADNDKFLGITVLGRPNVGKSTLINRLIGEDRLVVFDQPGTTRDSIAVPFESNKTKYMLFDTAGVRRKAKVRETIEKFSIVKALRSMEKAHVVLVLMDAQEGITEQDVSLIGLTVQRGRSLVVVVNKWDGLTATKKKQIKEQIDRRLPFLDFAEQHTISALYGKGVNNLLPAVQRAYKSATMNLSTKELTNVLEKAVQQHPPPLARGRRIRLRYAHQGGRNPPIIVIHGNQTKKLPNSYRRYLINCFRKKFNLHGTPVQLFFKTGDNPYKGKKNELTQRQKRKRQRLMKHVKKK